MQKKYDSPENYRMDPKSDLQRTAAFDLAISPSMSMPAGQMLRQASDFPHPSVMTFPYCFLRSLPFLPFITAKSLEAGTIADIP